VHSSQLLRCTDHLHDSKKRPKIGHCVRIWYYHIKFSKWVVKILFASCLNIVSWLPAARFTNVYCKTSWWCICCSPFDDEKTFDVSLSSLAPPSGKQDRCVSCCRSAIAAFSVASMNQRVTAYRSVQHGRTSCGQRESDQNSTSLLNFGEISTGSSSKNLVIIADPTRPPLWFSIDQETTVVSDEILATITVPHSSGPGWHSRRWK